VLEILALKVPSMDGVSLLGGKPRAAIFAEHSNQTGAMVRDRDFLYSWSKGNPFIADGEFLFDVRRDPQQRTNLAISRSEVSAAYAAKLDAWANGHRSRRGTEQWK